MCVKFQVLPSNIESNNERTASISLSLSMLENILTISRESRIRLSGKLLLLISSIKSTKCDVSFEISDKFDVKGVQMLFKNLDQFSIAVLHPIVNNITSISDL